MGLRIGAVITVAAAMAVGLVLLAREHTALGQGRREVKKDVSRPQEELFERIRKLEAEKVELEQRAQKLQTEEQALRDLARQQVQRVDKEKPADFKPDAPRPTFRSGRPQGWEYQVLSLTDSDEVTNQKMRRLTDEGWEYLTVSPSAVSQNHVIYPRVIFRRLTKTTAARGDQDKRD
jgi:TolA-binding protein